MRTFGLNRRIKADARAFAAAAMFIATDFARYYLQGVFVTRAPELPGILLVATDGYTLGVVHDAEGETNGDWICAMPSLLKLILYPSKITGIDDDGDDYVISNPSADLGKIFFDGQVAYVTDKTFTHASIEDARIIGEGHLGIAHVETIDGKYPDWRRVWPTPAAASGSSAPTSYSFNPDLLGRMQRALAILTGESKPQILFFPNADKNGPTIVRCPAAPNFGGLVMPMLDRSDGAMKPVPDFIGTTEPKPETV